MSSEYHDKNGLFKPGNPGGGRKPRAQENEALESIRENLPPGEIGGRLVEAYELAQRQNSWRGMVAVLELALAYTLGKPGVMEGQQAEGVNLMINLLQNIQEQPVSQNSIEAEVIGE